MPHRRWYSPEYEQDAVRLEQQSDIPVSEIARNLGLHDNMLRSHGAMLLGFIRSLEYDK